MSLRMLQTAAESGNVFELTFTLYEENAGPYSADRSTAGLDRFHFTSTKNESKWKQKPANN